MLAHPKFNHRHYVDLLLTRSRSVGSPFKLCIYFRRLTRYSPFHKQERKLFVFPNTKFSSIYIPPGSQICRDLDAFKIKSSKRDFKRCTGDISKRGAMINNDASLSYEQEPTSHVIQLELTTTAIELMENMPHLKTNPESMTHSEQKGCGAGHGRLALDIGCGRGMCMHPLVEKGYTCVGVDLDLQSLASFKNNKNSVSWVPNISVNRPEVEDEKPASLLLTPRADVVRWDMRHGLPFRDHLFDSVISISFLQWLFHGNQPLRQLHTFYSCISNVLCSRGVAVIQFYPRNQKQLSMAVSCAVTYFRGALIGTYPHIDRGRKLFLLLHKL